MKPRKIIEQVFEDEFGDDWHIELRDFEHGFHDWYDCAIKAIRKVININAFMVPADRGDAEMWLNVKKDIWNHPRVSDINNKESYEVADLMAEFANKYYEK